MEGIGLQESGLKSDGGTGKSNRDREAVLRPDPELEGYKREVVLLSQGQ